MEVESIEPPTHHLAIVTVAAALVPPAGFYWAAHTQEIDDPAVEVWTDRADVRVRGDLVKVYFRTDTDAYVTILRADTDGRISILYPANPTDPNQVRGGVPHQVNLPDRNYSFAVEDYPGEGYLFALATHRPFDYRRLAAGNGWNYGMLAHQGRIVGDPYRAIEGLAEAIAPPDEPYAFDAAPYSVQDRFDYPRFLCYDCHAYAEYPEWDPYQMSCLRFRIVVYDDPYRHGARYYGAARVVYPNREPTLIDPMYVFRDRGFGDSYITHVPLEARDGETRRRVDPGITSLRFGGIGTVTAPTAAARRRAPETESIEPSRLNPTELRPTLERRNPRGEPTETPAPEPDPR